MILDEILQSATQRLIGPDDLRTVTILTVEDGDLVNALKQKLAQFGVCAFVDLGGVTMKDDQSRRVHYEKVELYAEVYERVLINRVQGRPFITARALAERIAARWKMWTPVEGSSSPLLPDGTDSIAPVDAKLEGARDLICSQVSFFCRANAYPDRD